MSHAQTATATKAVICPYCDRKSERVMGDVIYPRLPKFWGLAFYRCVPCGAHVGTHAASGEPFGRLANAELRRMRQRAHQSFDPLWRSGSMSRDQAYGLLREGMRLTRDQCHIGDFNEVQCRRVIEICRAAKRKQRSGS